MANVDVVARALFGPWHAAALDSDQPQFLESSGSDLYGFLADSAVIPGELFAGRDRGEGAHRNRAREIPLPKFADGLVTHDRGQL